MPTRVDWERFRDAARQEADRRGLVRPQVDAGLTHRARTLLEHPGWQLLLDWIASTEARVAAHRADLADRVLDQNLPSQDLQWLLLDARQDLGYLRALKHITELIPGWARSDMPAREESP